MSRIYQLGIVLLCLGASLGALAEEDGLSPAKRVERGANAVVLNVGTGVGTFQDIQVPMNTFTGARGNGVTDTAENLTHVGIPIYFSLGRDLTRSSEWRFRIVELDIMRMGASNGAPGTLSSGYSRLGLSSDLERNFTLQSVKLSAGAQVELRRSSFTNTAEAHFVDAAVLGTKLKLMKNSYALDLNVELAPVARFGYSSGGYLGGDYFAQSSARLGGGGVNFLLPIDQSVWLDFGVSTEIASVKIKDISQYRDFGLLADKRDHSPRTYTLTTNVAHLGFRKEF